MIRHAAAQDLPQIRAIYANARNFMAASGNPGQWGSHFPPQALLESDIQKGQLYVCAGRDGAVYGVFAFILGEDPTYRQIENGSWLSDSPYGTIHRLASDGHTRGVFSECLAFCSGIIPHLRIDTHADNRVMQHLIRKHGFSECGIIHVADGSPRTAFERL